VPNTVCTAVREQNEEEAVKMAIKEEKAKEIEKSNIKAKSKMTKVQGAGLSSTPAFHVPNRCRAGMRAGQMVSADMVKRGWSRFLHVAATLLSVAEDPIVI